MNIKKSSLVALKSTFVRAVIDINVALKESPTDGLPLDAVEPTPETTQKTFDCLTITHVQVWPYKCPPKNTLGYIKGVATIVLNDQLLIRGLRICEGQNGLFVGYPNDPDYKGEDFRSITNPITRQLCEAIKDAVLTKYQTCVMEG